MNTRKKKQPIFICLAFAFVSFSCTSSEDEPESVLQVSSFKTRSLELSISGTSGTEEEFDIKLEYPTLKDQDSSLINSILRYERNWFIQKSVVSDSIYTEPKQVIEELEVLYAEFKKDFPEINTKWYFKRSLEVLSVDQKYLTLAAHEKSFLGGTHPNELIYYRIINVKNGNRTVLANLLSEEEYERSQDLAERVFLDQKGLKEGDDLKANGWFFPGGKFTLTNNFYLTDSTLVFYYNRYDIGSYEAGATKLELKLDEILKQEA